MFSLTGSVNRIVKVDGVQIEAVDRFAYLGSIIAAGGGTNMDIENRINKARVPFEIFIISRGLVRISIHAPITFIVNKYLSC